MSKFTVAVSIGHNPKSPGYKTYKTSEYQEMAPVAGFLVSALQASGCDAYLIGSRPLDQKVAQVNNIPGKADCAIELHLNAGGGYGFETLYCPGSASGKVLADTIHASIKSFLGSRDRGVKEGWYGMAKSNGPDFFLQATNCPSIITEAYFLDNEDEQENYVGNTHFMYSLANKIAAGILLYLTRK